MAWYRNDKTAVTEALRRGERPDLATTMASGPLDELVALHEELGIFAILEEVEVQRERAGVSDELLLRTLATLPFVEQASLSGASEVLFREPAVLLQLGWAPVQIRAGSNGVLATWVIRSKTCASRMIMTFLHCLQTKEGECKIRSRQHTTHARITTISRDGEAYSMGRVFIHLPRLKGFCSGVLHSYFVRWTKPLSTSLLFGTITDLNRSKSELPRDCVKRWTISVLLAGVCELV
jgi:hypothetical protein